LKKSGRIFFYLTIFNLFILFIFLSSYALADDGNYTVADVVSSQTQNASAVQSISSNVVGTTEFNGMTQNLSYNYQLTTDSNGNNKIMVTTKTTKKGERER
jgi:hypothetical protein